MKRAEHNFFFRLFILSVSLFLFISGCGVYSSIQSYSDSGTDFSKYKTFAWLPDSGMSAAAPDSFRNTAYDNDVIRNNAKNYIAHELATRGLFVQVKDPDLLIQLALYNEKKERLFTYAPFYYPYYYRNRFYYPYYYPYYDYYTYYGWGCHNDYCGPGPVSTETYVKGRISVNVYDRKLKKLVWTGSAEGDIYDPDYVSESVHPAIRNIMKQFPGKYKVKDKTYEATSASNR